mgnify:CR=1 FL=1
MRLRQAGFTLVEMLIVLALMGILTAIAVPQYNAYRQRSNRADAKVALAEGAQRLERFFTRNSSYLGADNTDTGAKVPVKSGSGLYSISFDSAPTAGTYVLQAVPTGNQTADSCGTLKIDQTGRKWAEKGGSAVAGCW